MAEKDPSKTENATAKRRKKQRDEGNVPKSGELSKTMTILMGLIFLRLFIEHYYDNLRAIFKWGFSDALSIRLTQVTTYELFLWGIKQLTLLVLPLMLVIAFASYLTLRIQVGKLWTTKPMKPKWGKMFNIMKGIKKLMISPQAFIKLGKSLGQAIAVGIAPYIIYTQEFKNFSTLFYQDAQGIAIYLLSMGYKMTLYALIPMLLISAADLWYTRWKYEEDIKMTKDEVKDERKQAEGDPVIKNKQKQKVQEFMMERMFGDVQEADVVITNPTHYAIAIAYDPMRAPAPLILAKGVNHVAEKIKTIAKEHNIPIKENKELARALYRQVEIGETIPEEMFQAVASILAGLEKFKRKQ